jgi:hypothetical protein
MTDNVNDLTIEYEEDGVITVKQLDKKVLTKGAWATLIYKFQNWDRKKETYGKPAFTIRRYQKRNGEYQQRSKFNISSEDQAKQIIDALSEWILEDK